jgi:D-hexose-6-phosphate mutarotase
VKQFHVEDATQVNVKGMQEKAVRSDSKDATHVEEAQEVADGDREDPRKAVAGKGVRNSREVIIGKGALKFGVW